jgi:hypothetical protein
MLTVDLSAEIDRVGAEVGFSGLFGAALALSVENDEQTSR